MRFLRLTLAPELVPIQGLVSRIEIINNRYLADGTVIELARIEGDHDDIERLYEDDSTTIDFETITDDGNQQYVYHRLQPDENNVTHQMISLLDEHCLMIVYPIRFERKTGVSVTLMGTTNMIQEAYEQFPAEIERYITIEQVTESMPALGGGRSLLTERQREVLDAAIDLGYYSIPRRVTSRDVAEAVECAPSTASEHLRKIEARILSSLKT